MSNPDNNNMDWSGLERLFGGPLPFIPDGAQGRNAQDYSWIQKYVNSVLNRTMPSTAGSMQHMGREEVEIFETHYHIILKKNVPNNVRSERLRVWSGVNRLKIEGLSQSDDPVDISLPKLVDPDSARALLKEGVLQIKLRKDSNNDFLKEVPVRFT